MAVYLIGNWIQIGGDIDGEAVGDVSGASVCLSEDGSCVIIGAPRNNGNGLDSGHVRIYTSDLYVHINTIGIGVVDPPSGIYELGTNLLLKAVADNEWLFVSWSGDVEGDYITATTNIFLVDGSKSITATFSDDADGDGLTNVEEVFYGTNPRNNDTDDDGLGNGAEVNTHGTDPLDADSDNDGLQDGDEVNTYSTNPLDDDSDNDDLKDGAEVNVHETDPNNSDSDDDELSDGVEVNIYGTNPNNPDSDNDLLPDGWEVTNGHDPLVNDAWKDLDRDGLTGLEEYNIGTSPILSDTDGDGFSDGVEVFRFGSNALNPFDPSQVDDNAKNDLGQGDPTISDPLEDGTKDHPYDAIQKAIDSASAGDVVVVHDGTYSGVGNRDIRFGGKALTIQSLNGFKTTLVENTYSAFIFDSNETTNSIIKGFTVHTWKDFFGAAGVVCDGASPTILDCQIWDCGEAGILCTNGVAPRIEECEIIGNEGGIRSYGSSPFIESCMIVSNTAGQGAGLFFESTSSARVVNCLIINNTATNEGGGVWVGAGSSPLFVHSTFAKNNANTRGGGMSSEGTPLLRNSIIYDNVAPESSGIFYTTALDIQYSCLQDFYPGIGNITTNPELVPRTFVLGAGSAAIDAGTAVYGTPFDLAGTQRPLDGTNDGSSGYDLGAYEFVHSESDTDGDEMPDYWEIDHQFDPTSNNTGLDSDGDGQDNHAEYITGLDPNDCTSFFAVTSESQVSGFLVGWSSISGRWYEVLWTPNLTNSFLPLEDLLDYPQSNYTDSIHNSEAAGFYKVEVRLKE